MLRSVITLSVVVLQVVNCSVRFDVNVTVAFEGNRTVLSCFCNSSVQWKFKGVKAYLFSDSIFSDHNRKISNKDGLSQLTFLRTSEADVGNYQCETVAGKKKAIASLTVIRSLNSSSGPPTPRENDTYTTEFQLSYTGDAVPKYSCQDFIGNTLNFTCQTRDDTKSSSHDVKCWQTWKVDVATVDRCAHTCTLMFVDVSMYTFNWSKPRILYDVRNLRTYPEGNQFKCVADGEPIPSYEWIRVGTNEVVSRSQELNFASTEGNEYICRAQNNIGNDIYNLTSSAVHVNKTPAVTDKQLSEPPSSVAVGLYVCTCMMVIIVTMSIVVVVFLMKRRRVTETDASGQNSITAHADSTDTLGQSDNTKTPNSYESIDSVPPHNHQSETGMKTPEDSLQQLSTDDQILIISLKPDNQVGHIAGAIYQSLISRTASNSALPIQVDGDLTKYLSILEGINSSEEKLDANGRVSETQVKTSQTDSDPAKQDVHIYVATQLARPRLAKTCSQKSNRSSI